MMNRAMSASGLAFSAQASAYLAAAMAWLLFFCSGIWLLRLSVPQALLGSMAAVVIHWFSVVIHDLGHAWAARRVGYPMAGIRFWMLFGTCLYPPAEPPLPAAIHIRRALGGPAASLAMGLIGAGLALALRPAGGLPWYLSLFLFLDNLIVLGLGAFLPLGFTDGSTLLHYWRRP